MTGLPYLPKRDFEVTLRSSPTRCYINGKLDKYLIEGVIKKNGLELGPRKWRTSNRFLWHELDRIERELGTLFNVTLKIENSLNPVKVVSNPNIPMFDMKKLER